MHPFRAYSSQLHFVLAYVQAESSEETAYRAAPMPPVEHPVINTTFPLVEASDMTVSGGGKVAAPVSSYGLYSISIVLQTQ